MKRLLAFVLLALASASAQFMQAIPPKTADNCEVRADKMDKWLLDWANLTRYQKADSDAIRKSDPSRVVFMGDSITDHWDLAASFPGKPYVNRGISGQTTSQMLIRFQPDVVNLRPSAVVILAGTNDIAGNTGPILIEQIENNFSAMAAIARANKIPVIVSSILPVHNYTEASQKFFVSRPMAQIRVLNDWLRDFAKDQGYVYVDYFSVMLDEKGLLKRELAADGLHPNAEGYKMMAEMLQKAIDETLQKRNAPLKKVKK
ncbi:MAG TPA: SGNH/GDSL hydrolase family protein [Terriglobales bacterium]|nr:SGNH/GDSL hydrolase family protein [Terriglobales bacterium]